MNYEKPNVVAAGSAVATIQNPTPNPKLTSNILDSVSQSEGYHTVSAYAADE